MTHRREKLSQIPQTFDHHILLYAKNWYRESGNVIQDLKEILAEYSGEETHYISDSDIRELLCNCFAKYAPKHEMGRWIQEMMGWGWVSTIRSVTPEQVMIGALTIAEGKYVDPTKAMEKFMTDSAKEKVKEMLGKS